MSRKLIFAYIEHHKCLHQVKLNFDPSYSLNYDPETKILSVHQDDKFPEHFWPDNISSVSVIAGKNGTGKSSILRWLLKRTVEGYPVDELNGIIAMEDNEGLKIYHDVTIVNKAHFGDGVCENVSGWSQDRLRVALAIPSVFCSGHFDVHYDYSPSNSEVGGMRNLTDKWLLIHDLESNRKVDASHFTYTLGDHLNAYIVENDIRICELLLDKRFQDLFQEKGRPSLRLPRYIVFSPDTSGDINIRVRVKYLTDNYIRNTNDSDRQEQAETEFHRLKRIDEIPHNSYMRKMSEESGQTTLHDFLYASLKNFYYYFVRSEFIDAKVIEYGINLFCDNYNYTDLSVLDWVTKTREDIDNQPELQAANGFIQLKGFFHDLAQSMDFLSNRKWKNGLPVIDCVAWIKDDDFEAPNDAQTYADIFPKIGDTLRRFMVSKDSFNQRFFTISYSHNALSRSQLSSGELEMLNLYSRIRYASETPMPGGGYEKPNLIYLDEVEVGFHPEWQRQFVNKLTQFVSMINQGRPTPIQIIYTTHSPITLSDMPKECVNLLTVNPNKESSNVKVECKMETFGANVFELYGDSFFMKDGLIGEFASEKILALNAEIENLKDDNIDDEEGVLPLMNIPETNVAGKYDDLRRRVNMIGDKRIKAYLHSRLDIITKDEEIRRLEDRIADLKARKHRYDEED